MEERADVEELLRELGALDRWLTECDRRVPSPEPERTEVSCWPAWRILLSWSNSPDLFAAWWGEHGSLCERCSSARERVLWDERLGAPGGHSAAPQVLAVLSDASSPHALPYAASTHVRPEESTAELPLVTYHKLDGSCDPTLNSVWCVAWDNSLFILLAGPEEALAKWRSGASLTDSEGVWLGTLAEVRESVLDLLVPGGCLDGQPVLVLQSERSMTELRCEAIAIPFLLSGTFRLLPVSEHQAAVQTLIADLASRNRVGRFLANLPEHVAERAEALTLSFYLRLLLWQGRLNDGEKRRIARLEWLAQDIKDALEPLAPPGAPQ